MPCCFRLGTGRVQRAGCSLARRWQKEAGERPSSAQGVSAARHLPPYLFLLSVALFPLLSQPRRAARQSDHRPPRARVSAELGKSHPLRPSCGHGGAACPTSWHQGKAATTTRGLSSPRGLPGAPARSRALPVMVLEGEPAPATAPRPGTRRPLRFLSPARWVEGVSGQRINQQLPGKQKPCLHRAALGALAQAAVAWPWGAAAHPDLLLVAPGRRQASGPPRIRLLLAHRARSSAHFSCLSGFRNARAVRKQKPQRSLGRWFGERGLLLPKMLPSVAAPSTRRGSSCAGVVLEQPAVGFSPGARRARSGGRCRSLSPGRVPGGFSAPQSHVPPATGPAPSPPAPLHRGHGAVPGPREEAT